MIIKDLWQRLKDNEIDVSLNGESLDISYDGELDQSLLEEIRENKAEIVSFLKELHTNANIHSEIPVIIQQSCYDLSSSQKRLWVLSQFEDANLAYNMGGSYKFEGDLDPIALERSFAALIERHEVLRTVFREDENGTVKQFILSSESDAFKLVHEDLRKASKKESKVVAIVRSEMTTLFNLAEGPLIRGKLIQLEDNVYIFNYIMHHIISDGWSMEIIIKELFVLYDAYTQNKENPLEPLRIQYKDYAAWQQNQLREENIKPHREYWLKQFEGDLPKLEIATDRPRPSLKTYNGGAFQRTLSKEINDGIKQLSKGNGGTLFMGMLSIVNALLYKYSNQSDIIIGSGIAGREHVDLENQIGYYLNTLPLRTVFNAEQSFIDLFNTVKEITLEAFEHQVYPLDELISNLSGKHDLSRGGLFDVSVVLQNTDIIDSGDEAQSFGNVEVSGYGGAPISVSTFDLSFTFEEYNDELNVKLIYNSDIYVKEFAERLLVHLEQLCNSIIATPEKALYQLDYLNEMEKSELLETFNSDAVTIPADKTFVDFFEKQVDETPDNVAIHTEGKAYTYQEINEMSNQLAHYIQKNFEVKPNEIVGINIEKRDQMLIAILGVFKSGAAYLPIDPDYPRERINYMIQDSGVKLVIDDDELSKFNMQRSRYSKLNLGFRANPSDLAYLIYTSGSTGKPKGVMVEHHSLLNLCFWQKETFEITENDRSSLYLGVAFDASVSEIFAFLISGAALYVIPSEIRSDITRLGAYFDEHGITISALTTIIGEQFLEIENNSLRYLIIGGDKLNNLKAKNYKVVNQYGPTENTVVTTNCILENDKDYYNLPIGKPIHNVKAYILDDFQSLKATGIVGELFVSGIGISRGYINNQELTEKNFLPNPFDPQSKMYRTGDLCRWLPDGNIEYIGRKDNQVKIRGYRIELGEIENALQSSDLVTACAVVVKSDANGEKSLVAYLTAKESRNTSDLRAFLKTTLPDFMIPEHFVQLESLPLTRNGKLDKDALPNPAGLGIASGVEYVAPRNEIEAQLVNIWKQVLGHESIGIKDDFFELGGHSLKATKLSSLISKEFQISVSFAQLFTNTTVEDQAQLIANETTKSFDSIQPAPKQENYPLSSSQRRLMVLSQFEEANTVYNVPGFYRFKGDLDIVAMNKALISLIERHEILRTVFKEDEFNSVKQYINSAESSYFQLKCEDLRGEDDPVQSAKKRIIATTNAPFDLSEGPLFRVKLFRIGEQNYVFGCVMHHIICDGWSMEVLINDLLSLYAAYNLKEENPLAPLKLQYKDYVVWQENQLSGSNLESHKQYWLNQFEGELPILELPADMVRPAVKTFNGNEVQKIISKNIAGKLNQISQDQGGTMFMAVLACINALMYKYSNQTDVILGSPIAGRTHADLEEQIGLYINTLAIRTQFSEEDSYTQLFEKVKEATLGAYEHQVYPFEELIENVQVERDLSRNALFDVMVILQNIDLVNSKTVESIGSIEIENFEDDTHTSSKFDLTFNFVELNEELVVNLEYNTDIYTLSTAERILNHLELLIASIVSDPSTSLQALSFLADSEKKQLLAAFNDTHTEYNRELTIVDQFEQVCIDKAEKTALVFEDRRYSFSELNALSNQFSHFLKSKYSITANTLIGIQLERSEWMVIAIWGILKAGGAYVPLDTEYPEDRVLFIKEDALLATIINAEELSQFKAEIQEYSKENTIIDRSLTDLAYVIYTSGSTGKPKGVMVEHGNVSSFFRNLSRDLSIEEVSCFAAMTSHTFDISVLELLGTLVSGIQVRLCSNKDAFEIISLIRDNDVDGIQITPSKLNQLIEHDKNVIHELDKLKVVLVGGEPMTYIQYQVFKESQNAKVFNVYGPTETTIWSSFLSVKESSKLSIGNALSNESIYILSGQNQLLPIGVVGEICIGGEGVARGYLNNEELTASRFIANPFKAGERIYKTGDLGKRLPDGTITFIGRKDDQVKIRGVRIELGEIENALLSHNAIDTAVVLVKSDSQGNKNLVAYIVGSEEFTANSLRAYLKDLLPANMVPAFYVRLEEIPLMISGKVNKKALPDPEGLSIGTGAEYVAPSTDLEKRLVEIWSSILNVERIGIKDDFFDLGGHSLKATVLISEINYEYKVKLSLKDIFLQPTIEGLAEEITNAQWFKDSVIEDNEYVEFKI